MNKKIDAAVAGFGTACFMLSAYVTYITLADAHIRFATGVKALLIGSFVLWGILGIAALKNLLDITHPLSVIDVMTNGFALCVAIGAMWGLISWVAV